MKVSGLLVVGSLLVASSAAAQTPPPAQQAPAQQPVQGNPTGAPEGHPGQDPSSSEHDPNFKRINLSINPISIALLGRYGLNVEVMVAKHHGLIVNPFFATFSAGDDNNKSTYTNFGGELGYRYYTGTEGANGFFIGPFINFTQMSLSNVSGGTTSEGTITAFGGGVDFGGQAIIGPGLTVSGGLGINYVSTSTSGSANGQTGTFTKIDGVLPRFLATVGYAF